MNGSKTLLRNLAIIALGAMVASIAFKSVFDETGFIRGKRIQERCARERAEVAQLEQENMELRKEIIELRKKKSHRLEILGRTEFGMSRPGEVVFSFPKDHDPAIE